MTDWFLSVHDFIKIIILSFSIQNRRNIIKIVKFIKLNIRKFYVSKNINAFENWNSKKSNLNDFLAEVTSAIPSFYDIKVTLESDTMNIYVRKPPSKFVFWR